MKRDFIYKNIPFYIGNYTPRNNKFEHGLKYRLFVNDIPTEHVFATIKECKNWIMQNYFIYL